MARRRKARLVASLAASRGPHESSAAAARRPPDSDRKPVKRHPRGKLPSSASDKFPLISLPPELTLLIASFLGPRTILALLIASPAFTHLSSIFTKLSRQDYLVNERGRPHHYTPLQFFCSRGIESIIRRLLLEGADPNEVSYAMPKNQLSPLAHAINFHSASIVSLLIQHGAQVNARDHHGQGYSALEIAVSKPHQLHPPFFAGYTPRRAELPHIVQLLLDAHADITTVHQRRGTPLHMACAARNANPQIVAALIAAGADVHCGFAGHGELAYRLARGLDSDIQPIHYAASAGNVAVVQLLLDAGADIEAATRNGIRPLDNAVLAMRDEVVVMLLAAGADERTREPQTRSAGRRRTEVERLESDTAGVVGVTDPWVLSRKTVVWDVLERYLLLRGCMANYDSMQAWGLTSWGYLRYPRRDSFPFLQDDWAV